MSDLPENNNGAPINSASRTAQSNNSRINLAAHLYEIWLRYGLYLFALLFAITIFIFLVNKHNAFNTRTYDFARFSQAIWNTLHGRPLFSSIDARSIMGNHFSPYMALLSPLFVIWPNERVLFLVQAVSVSSAGLILALMLRKRHRALAPWFLLAFCLNPAVQQMALFEFRRVVLALPFLALALFALAEKRRWLMFASLFVALLAKEDIGLFVFGAGLYLWIFQHDWRWGLAMMLLGFGWSSIATFWVIPAFRTPGTEYPQLFYFDYLGGSYSEILDTLRQDPLILPRQLIGIERLSALWRIFLPLGLFLPFLGADWLLIALPPLLLLLLSGDAEMFGLQKWYTATILPIFFAAVAIGLGRFPIAKARWLAAWLLLAALAGYWLYSPLPGGREYDSSLYKVTDHDRLGLALVQEIPAAASVATQPHYAPHLTQREDLYHYPWIKIGRDKVEYFLFDTQSSPYPFNNEELAAEINSFLADPWSNLVAEADGIFIFQQGGNGQPAIPSVSKLEDTIQLQGFDIAVQDDQGVYRRQDQLPVTLQPGDAFRVALFWQALSAPGAERTISVRVADQSGWLFAQHDGIPARASKPTSWWQPEQRIRDMHYLTLSPGAPSGPLSLDLVVYDTYSQKVIPWGNGQETLHLAAVEVLP